jgi:hypothetical protein
MPVVELICLANSRKHAGRCVAGLRTDGKGWIRPIGPRQEGVLFDRHYTLRDGSVPGVLDVLRISLIGPRPEPHHPENWLINPARWQLVARPAAANHLAFIEPFIARGPDLLGSRTDREDFHSFLEAPAPASLVLVRPEQLAWRVVEKRDGARQARVQFMLGVAGYNLAVTDPIWEQRLGRLPLGTHPATAAGLKPDDEVLLTVSLSEPFQDGLCYKLVAGVIVLPASRACRGLAPTTAYRPSP